MPNRTYDLEDRFVDFAVRVLRKPLCEPANLKAIRQECDELIAILVTSVKTAQRNAKGNGQ